MKLLGPLQHRIELRSRCLTLCLLCTKVALTRNRSQIIFLYTLNPQQASIRPLTRITRTHDNPICILAFIQFHATPHSFISIFIIGPNINGWILAWNEAIISLQLLIRCWLWSVLIHWTCHREYTFSASNKLYRLYSIHFMPLGSASECSPRFCLTGCLTRSNHLVSHGWYINIVLIALIILNRNNLINNSY